MNKIITLSFALVVIFCACSKVEVDESAFNLKLDTSLFDNVRQNKTSTVVSINDVQSILNNSHLQTKTKELSQYDIIPYLGEHSDTLMFIVNFKNNNGWKIYSTDMRTPAILAEGESGYFSLEDGNPAVAIWIARVAEDMARIKKATDDELSFSKEEILHNKAFWTGEQVRFNPGDPIIDPPAPFLNGHWEETITSQTIVYDTLGHLVAKWDQGDPYNNYCPYIDSTYSGRAAAGCVAIAGAQVLYYLHGKIGVPSSMYTNGYCYGTINSYTREFFNLTSTIWDYMSPEYRSPGEIIPEALMIGHVGDLVSMHYWNLFGNQFSWAWPGNIHNEMSAFGLECIGGDYDPDIVKSSLLEQMPIIVTATDDEFPAEWHIHTFVIDGYRRTQIKYTHYHHFVLDETPTGPFHLPADYITYTYSSPALTSITINWGWWSQWTNNENEGWYSLTGSWIVTNDTTYDYNNRLGMLYGFDIST